MKHEHDIDDTIWHVSNVIRKRGKFLQTKEIASGLSFRGSGKFVVNSSTFKKTDEFLEHILLKKYRLKSQIIVVGCTLDFWTQSLE